MARSAVNTGDASVVKVQSEILFRDAKKKAYFSRFFGKGANDIVQEDTRLEKNPGDEVTFSLVPRLTGAGVGEGQQLVGNEEKLNIYTSKVTLAEKRHGVLVEKGMTNQRLAFDLPAVAKSRLEDWGGEYIDQVCFDSLGLYAGSSNTPTKVFYLNRSGSYAVAATTTFTAAKAGVDTGSALTLNFISALKTWALTGGNRSYIPPRPVMIDGKPHFILLAHPDAYLDLETSSDFKTAMEYAEVRGKDNPLISGAKAVWNGMIMHDHENCAIAADGGAGSSRWCRGALLGAQSLVWAWGERQDIVKDTFDYEHDVGYGWSLISGCKHPTFNSKSYGAVGVAIGLNNSISAL